MRPRIFVAVAGLTGAVSVGADAAARHLLAGDAYRLDLAMTSARYGLIHAAALLAIAAWQDRNGSGFWLGTAGWLFVAGIGLFCGSLDLIAAGAPHGFAMLTPWGGTAFIAGWISLLIAALRSRG